MPEPKRIQLKPISLDGFRLRLSPDEFRLQMKEIEQNDDIEEAHGDADELMCSLLDTLGYGQGVEIFRNMDRWYA